MKTEKPSERVLQVIVLLADGMTKPQISQKLGISTDTVKRHVETAMNIAAVNQSTGLVATAIRRGWIK